MDLNDDMILDVAVRANFEFIVTYNKLDFTGVNQFGKNVVMAQEFLKIIEGIE